MSQGDALRTHDMATWMLGQRHGCVMQEKLRGAKNHIFIFFSAPKPSCWQDTTGLQSYLRFLPLGFLSHKQHAHASASVQFFEKALQVMAGWVAMHETATYKDRGFGLYNRIDIGSQYNKDS